MTIGVTKEQDRAAAPSRGYDGGKVAAAAAPPRRRRVGHRGSSLAAGGTPMIWAAGGAMAVCLAMIVGLLVLIVYQGSLTFWPLPVVEVRTKAGQTYLGEVTRSETYQPQRQVFDRLPDDIAAAAIAAVEADGGVAHRRLVRTGNYELTNVHFDWVSDFEIAEGGVAHPEWAVVMERLEWGRFYGMPRAFLIDGEVVADQPAGAWRLFEEHHPTIRERWRKRRALEKDDTGEINHMLEQARLELREVEMAHGESSPQYREQREQFEKVRARVNAEFDRLREQIEALNEENDRYQIRMATSDGREVDLKLADIVRAYPANQLSWMDKAGVYLSRWGEFLTADPREANTEGGVFPAIFGTVVMTLLMSVAVVPFGVLAALYLREYAKAGPMISAVRIAINNLAGVPSIVFGVFGLGFFCYIIGGTIDQLFYSAKLPSPTFGTGGIFWASLTLALLTLPVVIVATEEALAAVPGSTREGSYACGASKWQTIRRVVMPRAMPGVMTGAILAMARGAGEVAPLMLVGAVKLAPELPVDGFFPYVHLERSFMHLGFHIYDLGFQSPNSEAAKPMVFTTTLLLIFIIAVLNILAILLRSRLRRRFAASQF